MALRSIGMNPGHSNGMTLGWIGTTLGRIGTNGGGQRGSRIAEIAGIPPPKANTGLFGDPGIPPPKANTGLFGDPGIARNRESQERQESVHRKKDAKR
jgi:hypothetical protein